MLTLRSILAAAAMAAFTACSNSTAKGPVAALPAAPETPVRVAAAESRSVPVDLTAVGNVEPQSTVVVKSPVGGTIIKVHFQDGAMVQRGDPLFEIDKRPYEETVRMWEANIARDRAVLAQAEANLSRAQAQEAHYGKQAERYTKLAEQGIVSREVADQSNVEARARRTAVRAESAAIESAKANIRSAEAALSSAKLNLSYCDVKALIAGRVGTIRVNTGNLIKAAETELVTIHQVHPIYVAFSVPEENLLDIRRRAGSGSLPVTAAIPGDSRAPARGSLKFLENSVDTTTGTIRLKAAFDNADSRLWPGQFVEVRMRMENRPAAIVVPQAAIQTGQQGAFVYVVRADRTVEQRPVVTGPRIDSSIAINQGVAEGESVVTEGQLRLAPGVKVKVL